MTADKDRLFKKLEHVGEHVVRENLENGVYGPNRRGLVEEWLEQFEDNDEAELLLEEEHEDEAGALASEARKVAVVNPRSVLHLQHPPLYIQSLGVALTG